MSDAEVLPEMNRIGPIGPGVEFVIAILVVGCSAIGSPNGGVTSSATPTTESVAPPEPATPQATPSTEPSHPVAGGLPDELRAILGSMTFGD